jgi:hypothetical protein
LYSDDEFISGNVLENTRRNVLELNANFSFLFVKGYASVVSPAHQRIEGCSCPTFPCFQNPRDSIPPLVADISNEGTESWTAGVRGNRVVFLVCGFGPIERFDILANDDVFGLDW